MKIMMSNDCLRADKLLLCLLIFYCLGCSNLRKLDREAIKGSQPIFQVAVKESDLTFFIQRIQELNLVPMDLQQRVQNPQNSESQEFWLTFQFVTKEAFLVGRSEIISTGVVRRLSYK